MNSETNRKQRKEGESGGKIAIRRSFTITYEEKKKNREKVTESNHFAESRMLYVYEDVDNPTSAGGMVLTEGGGAELVPGTMLPARLRGTSCGS